MKKWIVIMAMLATGCEHAAEAPTPTSNADFKVEKLFTDENGYTVHRFMDCGIYHYYVTGPAGGSVQWQQSQGKTTRTESIETAK